jgi:hypothetical protein
MSKYGNNKIIVDGITFDSKEEAKYYEYLKDRKAKGEILNFELQPKYELLPAFTKHGKKYRPITYAPDFLIYHNDGTDELIDVKGMSTQQGELRRKMFDHKYDIKLTWIARSLKYSDTGWIDFDQLQKIRRENKRKKDN